MVTPVVSSDTISELLYLVVLSLRYINDPVFRVVRRIEVIFYLVNLVSPEFLRIVLSRVSHRNNIFSHIAHIEVIAWKRNQTIPLA